MDSRKYVLRQTLILAIGEAVCIGLMLGIFALLQKFDTSVLLGGVIGGLVAVANYFFMALCATLAADMAQNQNVEGGKKLIATSRTLRFVALVAILVVCGISKVFNIIALVLPLAFQTPILLVTEFFKKKEA